MCVRRWGVGGEGEDGLSDEGEMHLSESVTLNEVVGEEAEMKVDVVGVGGTLHPQGGP